MLRSRRRKGGDAGTPTGFGEAGSAATPGIAAPPPGAPTDAAPPPAPPMPPAAPPSATRRGLSPGGPRTEGRRARARFSRVATRVVTAFVGTSGWQYRHWRDGFYPAGLAGSRWLVHYAERFSTVEVNASFYRLPRRETSSDGHERSDGFV